jgi:hypothetical protein
MDVNKYSQECKLRLAASIYFFKKLTGHNLFPVFAMTFILKILCGNEKVDARTTFIIL